VKSQPFRTFHGTVVDEPFRWLEDYADAGVQAWAEDQQRRTEEFLSRCGERGRCREFLAARHPSLDPLWDCARGSQRFRLVRRPGLSQPVLCVTDAGAIDRTLVDPNPDGKTIAAEYLAVSPSGRYVAFAQSASGDVRRTMRICDVATARIVDTSAVVTAVPMFAWLPDESGFFYTLFRQLFEDDGSGDARADGLYLHELGAEWRGDSCIRVLHDDTVRIAFAVVPEMGDCLLIGTHQFSSHSSSFSLHRLSAPLAAGTLLLSPSYNAYLGSAQGELYFHTGIDAPLGRVVAIKPAQPDPAHWRVLLGEPEFSLARPDRFPGPGKCAIGSTGLVVTFVEHAHNALRFYGHDGTLQDKIELPFLCTVDTVEVRGGGFRIVAQSFLMPRIEYHYEPCSRRLQEIARVVIGKFDFDRYELRQVFYLSFDGTRVPMYLLHRKELARHGNHPALLYGYGGFGQAITPEYMPEIALWLELGGVYAVANLRGGGEYGEAWHKAASRANKQVGFNDFYAAAEFLISEGITGAGKLCIRGISNGGLLTAVSANQRPDLFKAVISEIPLADMLWLNETQTGRSIGAEYGNPCESPAMFEALRAYSPAHNVHGDGPAQLVVVAQQDFNAPPGQAYKFVAARQAALAAAGRDTPVLLRLVKGEGHGGWREESTRSVLADEVAFLWHLVQGPARSPDLCAVDVPMRDGVRLCANVWLPARAARSSAVLLRTPYANDGHEFARWGLQDYLCAGFAVVIQSVRGRGNSQGEFAFFFVEGKDGYDSIEWIAAQHWCDGKVAMDGGSYLGTAQWLAARELPPHLVCIMPSVPAGDWFHEIPYVGGALQVDWAFSWLGLMAGLIFDFETAGDRNLERYRPLRDAEKVLGVKLPLYQEILAHPTMDAFWRRLQWSGDDFRRIDIPVFTVTGWFDGDQAGTLLYWCGMENHRTLPDRPGPPQSSRLLIGPWGHRECYLGGEVRLGEMEFGLESVLPIRSLRVEFLREHLQGETRGPHARVRLFITGSRCWKEFDRYPPAQTQIRSWFLCADAPANGAQGGGGLSGQEAHGAPDRYCYDPLDPVPYKAGAQDHAEIERRSDVLVYGSEEMQVPLTVVGAVELVLHASSDALDTDFTAKLLDVYPDGRAVSLTHVGGVQRARYRHGFDRAVPLTPGEPFELRIRLGHVGHTFLAAHRIRLEVSSSCFPLADPNTNTGADIAIDTAPRKAQQTVLHDALHPSRLLLPVMPNP
jgi:putative CocE/NonD family hydrolase